MSKKSKSVDFNYLNNAKVQKGSDDFLEETKSWKGGSHKERHEEKKESMRSVKKKISQNYQKSERVSWKKKATGIGIVVAICGVGLLNFLGTVMDFLSGTGIVPIDVKDSAKLKTVLFSGDPWLIYCVNNETVNQRIPKVLEDSTSDLWRNLGVRTGVLRCWDTLESGRSVAQRFKLKLSPPLTFAIANGDKPRLVDLIGVSKTEQLEKKVKPVLKTQVELINNVKKWPSLCTGRRTCVVVGHKNNAQKDTAMNLLRPLVDKHRNIKFVTVDTTVFQLKLDEGLLRTRPVRPEGKQKGADVLCLAREEGDAAKKLNATHSGTFIESLTANSVASFIQACESRTDLVPVPEPPKLSVRQKKAKVIKPDAPGRARPTPRPRPPPPPPRGKKVDRVGSRAEMERQEQEEALFEAVEETEGGDDESDEGGDSREDGEADGDSSDEEEEEEGQREEEDSQDDQVEL